jgi:microcystin-dependent protein
MTTAFTGEIQVFSFPYAPAGWLSCDGAALSRDKFRDLYAVIGTRYGSTGANDFLLPNLNGAVGIGAGSGPSLTPRTVGDFVGAAQATLTVPQMPGHQHQVSARISSASTDLSPMPTPNLPFSRTINQYDFSTMPVDPWATAPGLAASTIGPTGQGEAHENRQPHIAMTFCICVAGVNPDL